MSLIDQLNTDLKDAMRAGDALKRDTLRMVLAAMKNKRIEVGAELDDAAQMGVLQSAVKSRKDSAEQYAQGGRPELAEKEEAEIRVIEGYLPQQLGEAETRAAVEKAVADTGAASKQDLGKVMKAVMAAHKGVVDGKTVQRLAAELLG